MNAALRHPETGSPRSAIALLLMTTLAGAVHGDQVAITVDGQLDDWSGAAPLYEDPAGDGDQSGVDFGRLWVADDDRFLFLRIELGAMVNLSEDNQLRLYLDADLDCDTGLLVGGIGAELEWRFGERFGFYRWSGQTTVVAHDDIRLRSGPTVSSTWFELAIGRDTLPDGRHPLFVGTQLRILLQQPGGDQLPGNGELLSYTFDQGQAAPPEPVPLERQQLTDLRLATFNVKSDGPWQGSLQAKFQRLITATHPDILSVQEVYDHSAGELADLMTQWLPDRTWFAAGNSDCKTVSRYRILGAWPVDGNLAVLLDTVAVLGAPMLVINAHLPCCTNQTGRQEEIDHIMSFVRDARNQGGLLDLPTGAPIVITGDLNLVGGPQPLTTALSGDIVDEKSYGPDFAPDWDGTDLFNLVTRQTEKRMGYTWRSSSSSFWPGHLDYVIYADSTLDVGRHYVVYTPEMSAGSLTSHDLLSGDSLASDHLLFCADFRVPADTVAADINRDGVVNVGDLVALITSWGPCPAGESCPADVNGDGTVDVTDLVAVITAWG